MPFEITKDTLLSIEDCNAFVAAYPKYVADVLASARLLPKFAIQRLVEAHGAWQNDLHRVEENEPELSEGLDHFKRCGHLVFWLRRMSPMVEAIDLTRNLGDAEGFPLTDHEREFRELLFGYANEYLAFDFGFQVCKFYERGKADGSARAQSLNPTVEYYRTMCHFLKYKTVSPHAIFLIYKSLFA